MLHYPWYSTLWSSKIDNFEILLNQKFARIDVDFLIRMTNIFLEIFDSNISEKICGVFLRKV